MNQSAPFERRTRPAWGCLDNEEIQTAAAGHPVESGVREHLSRCAECRRAVQELRRELGLGGGHAELRPHGSSRLARRLMWLVLLAAAVVAAGVVVMNRRRPEQPNPVTSPEAAAVPDEPPRVHRVRPRPRPRPRTSTSTSSAAPSSIDAQIGATIRRNQSGIRVCYDRALKRNDGLALRLDVNVRLRSSGEVEQVSVDGPAGATALTACIRNVIRTWRFPPAPEPYGSTFPLLLQPGL